MLGFGIFERIVSTFVAYNSKKDVKYQSPFVLIYINVESASPTSMAF